MSPWNGTGLRKNMREDLVAFTFWAPRELKESLKRLSKVSGRSLQDLMGEALADIVAKHGPRHGIEWSTKNPDA
jgi:hypothetical protein